MPKLQKSLEISGDWGSQDVILVGWYYLLISYAYCNRMLHAVQVQCIARSVGYQ